MTSIGSLSAGKLAAAYAGSTDALATRATPERADSAPVAAEKRPVAVPEEQAAVRDANATQGTLVDTYL